MTRSAAYASSTAPPTQGRTLPTAEEFSLTDHEIYLFNEGTYYRMDEKFGAHPAQRGGETGTVFTVWAPNAQRVSVIGDFNDWEKSAHPLEPVRQSGVWQGFVAGARPGHRYKYHIESRFDDYRVDKADPIGFFSEPLPGKGSVICPLDYAWNDDEWIQRRKKRNARDAPMAIYEVHVGSWMRNPEDPNRFLTYRELAPKLAEYVTRLGFTHVELLPIMEHPLYRSWGYQTTGYFAATHRYGTPQDFMHFIDVMHQHGIGVILDWAPAHFPSDEHGLTYFDGTHLYEHAEPSQRIHPDWGSYIFNYGRHEVRSFLLSSAMFWLSRYHIDGLRVDAVASMLYLDYSREEGQWWPNEHGGRENLHALEFLRRFNEAVYREHPDVQTIAEESTAWPMVSRPTHLGGLGFGYKWDMGWMHDTLKYLAHEPVHRAYHHNKITFRSVYAFSENFILPLSHDEVVHGKASLLHKMPGDDWQQFANLRLLLAYMWSQPGKKMLFMGGEIAQRNEWNHDESLQWDLLEHPPHQGMQRLVRDLNRIYREQPSLHELDCDPGGFEWIDGSDAMQSVLTYLRRGNDPQKPTLIAVNFTPVPRPNYRVGVPRGGTWREILNTDATEYGGSGMGNLGEVEAAPVPSHGYPNSLSLTLPPLALLILTTP